MENREVARILEEVADILEIQEDNPFKVNAYRKAARSIYHLPERLEDVWKEGRLRDIPGVGKAIQAKVEEILATGRLEYHQRLLEEVPRGVVEMLKIPGLGPGSVRTIYKHLGITTFAELKEAARERKIRELPGLGAKTEYNIKKGLELLESIGERVTLGTVLPLARDFQAFLLQGEGVEKAELTGSIRRCCPVVGDIDILVATCHPEQVVEVVSRYRDLREMKKESDSLISGRLGIGFPFEVIMVRPDEFPMALLMSTGSKEHRRVLAKLLEDKGISTGTSEADIYGRLGMDWIPPELRESCGEFEAAQEGRLPVLVELSDIKGDLHTHTDWSDGASGLEDMIKKARSMGYSYLAVTDHSIKGLVITGGLDENKLGRQARAIAELNRKYKDFKVLSGIEVNIMRDGQLDLSDEVLSRLDVVVASIHNQFNLTAEEQTKRIISAIRNPHVDIIGHLTGRLLNRRGGYEVDVEAVLQEAARYGTILEINAHPDRLDISEEVARRAREMGVMVAINSDAHSAADLGVMEYGVFTARRGWLEAGHIINTRGVEEVITYLRNKPGFR